MEIPWRIRVVRREAAGLVAHAGMPEAVERGCATFGLEARRSYSAVVSDAVLRLTGAAPASAREVLTADRAAFAAGA